MPGDTGATQRKGYGAGKASRSTIHDLVAVSEGTAAQEQGESPATEASPAETSPGTGRGIKKLSGHQTKMLAHKLHDKLSHDDHAHGHGHGSKAPSILVAIISGIINFLLMFGLCAAYGFIMFADEHNERHTALGVKINLGSSLICGMLAAIFSKIRVCIAGPDLNPVVLIGTFISSMQTSIADELKLTLPTRRLASSSGGSVDPFCVGVHEANYPEECESFHGQLRATTIFATALSSLVFVVIFITFGRFKFTRYVSYIPTSIMEAFLSCIGYKVFLYALKFCKYDPYQFVPAACIGVTMYFMKAYHVGNPGIVMPLGFLLPLGAFYVVVYGIMGSDIDTARQDDLMFPKMENIEFFRVWTDSIGKPQYINVQAWLTTLPDLAIMIILVLLDCLLKINGTEAKLHIKADKDYEVQLHGVNNILTTLTGSSVGYMQLKFNVINAGVMQNTEDRRGGIVYALLVAATYFGTIDPINYMPRFFVGALLFFAGAGFVAENLWGSRRYLHAVEWLEVLIILAVFIVSGQLLVAVITGGVVCGISFIAKYARVPTIEGKPMRGAELRVVERRGPLVLRMIRHITESWLLVVRLKGYVFFASAQSLTAHVLSIIQSEEQEGVPLYRRLRIVVFDCMMLDGIDASASKAFAGFVKDSRNLKVRVLWSGLTKSFHQEFKQRGILQDRNVLADLDEAVMSVEDLAMRYLSGIEKKWMKLHKAFEDNKRILLEHYAFEPFVQVFLSTTGRIGCPWKYCSRLRIEGHQTVLWTPGETNSMLFLVHTGAVGLFRTLPQDDEHWGSPVAVYRHGWFLNRETLMRMPSKFYGVALEDGELLCWTQEQWWDMTTERPLMMSEILKGVMKQQARDCDTMEVFEHSKPQELDDDEARWDAVYRASSFTRQASDEHSDSDHHTANHLVGDQLADLPEILTTRLQNLESANSLSKLKFFKPAPDGQEGILPQLPEFMEKDLRVAFDTFSNGSTIASTEVCKALMFAGVFDYSQSYQASTGVEVLHSREDFMGIGHKALMWPLCGRDLRVIEVAFQKADLDKDGFLNRNELQAFLCETLSKDMQPEEVDGIVSFWGKNSRRGQKLVKLDLPSVTSVMSLFIRKHEHHWHMLQGFTSVLGTDAIKESDKLNVDHLVNNPNLTLSRQEAEEMIWANNWRLGNESASELPWTEFVSAVYVCIERQAGPLPPAPTINRDTFMRGLSCGTEVLRAESQLGSFHRGVSAGGASSGFNRGVSTGSHAGPRNHGHGPFQSEEDRAASGPVFQEREAADLAAHVADTSPDSPWGGLALQDEPPAPADEPSTSTGSPKTAKDWVAYLLNPSDNTMQARFIKRFGYFIIILSVLETILEPFIHGPKGQQTKAERRLWDQLELAVTIIFTIELLLRIVLAKKRVAELFSTFKYWCLLLATIPKYLEWLLGAIFDESSTVYRAVNLLRLARLARLSRMTQGHSLLEAVVVSLMVVWGIYKKHELDEPSY